MYLIDKITAIREKKKEETQSMMSIAYRFSFLQKELGNLKSSLQSHWQ